MWESGVGYAILSCGLRVMHSDEFWDRLGRANYRYDADSVIPSLG